jgi:hypothetical protein
MKDTLSIKRSLKHIFGPSFDGVLRKVLGSYYYDVLIHIIVHNRIPNPRHPVTFNDKLFCRKFHESIPISVVVANKALARDFVAERLGNAILTKLYFCGDNVEDINFDELPDDFVVKATHGSGSGFVTLIHDKHQFGETKLRQAASESLNREYGYVTNEWWYTKMHPQIIIEEMLYDSEYGVPIDYKFYVFHGKVEYVQVDYYRFADRSKRFYDKNWNPQEFTLGYIDVNYRMGPITPKPQCFSEMVAVAECIGKEFDFVRVDLYCVNDKRVVFGEITLVPGAGLLPFQPRKWDHILGAMW